MRLISQVGIHPASCGRHRRIRAIFLIVLLLSAACKRQEPDCITVFTAASTADAIKALAAAYGEMGGTDIRLNIAASGALARQIEAGAPADVFISANIKWMDRLAAEALIDQTTRFNLAGNRLVMIAPKGEKPAFDGYIHGRLAIGDVNSVPAGIYAQEALTYMGWPKDIDPKLVMGSNVRTVLMYVERGEVAAGIVYASDAAASGKVDIVGTFPAESHSPIVYPAAACSDKATALDFLAYLKTDAATAILKEHGFSEL